MKPAKILERAVAAGLTHIVINDHNTIQGGLDCKLIENQFNIKVIVGSEIKTDIGDVTGIFLTQEISPGPYKDVLAAIRKQGGRSILNHPFVGHKLDEVDLGQFDFVEGYNGRCTSIQNNNAVELAKKSKRPIVAGSDAHTYGEIGRNYSVFESFEDLLNAKQHITAPAIPKYLVYSQLIKSFKQKKPLLLARVLLSAPRKLLNR